jgi:hypothetical protein
MKSQIIAAIVGIGLLLTLLYKNRILIPFFARRNIKNILKNKSQNKPQTLENRKNGIVEGNANYLSFKNDLIVFKLRWDEIEEVHAYKRDLLTTDLICLAFKKSGMDEFYEINEEMFGYHALLELLPIYLSNFNMTWFPAVAFPAFETKHQIIWKKSPNLGLEATGAKGAPAPQP